MIDLGHLQTLAERYKGQIETYELVDPPTLKPLPYDKKSIRFVVDDRIYIIPVHIWHSDKTPLSPNIMDINLTTVNPSMNLELQLDLRRRNLFCNGYNGSKAIDMGNREDMSEIRKMVLADLWYDKNLLYRKLLITFHGFKKLMHLA